MSTPPERKGENEWTCATCAVGLEPAKVQAAYVGCGFTIELLQCPRCGLVLVTEDMAVGKMAEAEKVLEDK